MLAPFKNIDHLSSFVRKLTQLKGQNVLKGSSNEMMSQFERFICKKSPSLQETLEELKSDNLSETLKLISSSDRPRLVPSIDESMVNQTRKRALHVFTKVSRVESFYNTCVAIDLTDEDKLAHLG